jgi:hypothetical protein
MFPNSGGWKTASSSPRPGLDGIDMALHLTERLTDEATAGMV